MSVNEIECRIDRQFFDGPTLHRDPYPSNDRTGAG